MVEKYEDIDELFRKNLAEHKENPSPLAWEKLESWLSTKRKKLAFWRGIAASFLLVIGMISLLWVSIRTTEDQLKPQVQKEEKSEMIEKEKSGGEPVQEQPVVLYKESRSSIIFEPKPASISNRSRIRKPATEEPLTESRVTVREIPAMIEVGTIELPPLNTEFLRAEKGPVEQEIEAVAYKVTIFSTGISDQPEKVRMIKGVKDKIEKIGGLLNKVDQGLADLQDTKNNWFASIINNKSNNKN